MWAWLKRLFCGEAAATGTDAPEPPWVDELREAMAERAAPPWAAELGEQVQRAARAQGKVALRLDEIERKLEGGLLDLQRTLADAAPRAPGAGPHFAELGDLLDAIDLLDEAAASMGEDAERQPLRAGLLGVRERLDRFLGQARLRRHGGEVVGTAPDGRLFRVVGTEDRDLPGAPEGAITRVVRAAVTRGAEVVREGQVLTQRRTTAT